MSGWNGKSYRTRQRLWRDGGRSCYYCDKPLTMAVGRGNTLTVEHKMPLSLGGTNARANLAAACLKCNNAKGNMTEAEFRALGCDPKRVISARREMYEIVWRRERFMAKMRRIGRTSIFRNGGGVR